MTALTDLTGSPQQTVLDLRKYISIININKWRILSMAVLVSILAVLVVLNIQSRYASTATLLIESQQAKAVSIEEIYGMNSSQQEYYLTQFAILKSRSIAEAVVDTLNLKDHPDFVVEPGLVSTLQELLPFIPVKNTEFSAEQMEFRAREKLITEFQQRLHINPIAKTQLVQISFTTFSAELASQVANAVGEAYIHSQLEAKLGITQRASSWLGSRLAELRIQLDESEAQLQAYREKEGLIDVEGVRGLGAKELARLSDELTEARSRKAQIDGFIRVIRQYGINNMEQLESLPEITAHKGVQDVKTQLVLTERRVSELSKIYGPRHPKLMAAQSELTAVQDNLHGQIRKLIAGIENEARSVEENVSSLEAELSKAKTQYQDVSLKETSYQRLEREVFTNRQLYETFLARQKETQVTSDFNSAIARFTDLAVTATEPVAPKRKLILMLVFIATLGFGILVAFALDALNDTIKSPYDVENHLGQRALGFMPELSHKKHQDLPLYSFFSEQQKQYAEAVRSIRTSLTLLSLDKPMKFIELTSSVPSEGKSTAAVNLAFAFGQMEKVLLIDADMRRPSLAKRFGLPAYQPGLANLIAGREQLEDCIVLDEKSGISVLPAGNVPPNPLELLSSPRFAELLKQLAQGYDRIIIDTPPVQAVSDALLIAKQVDAVVYVVAADQTRGTAVQSGIAKLLQTENNLCGVILNKVNMKKMTQSYGDYSHYGYEHYHSNETN
ncbi:polysaccharide biosynthesis tyrosine autokinase [Rheinheimera soli]|uniref:non-specific protein-tyrosine kinase n=1 Tax=Rheinheimera soli TaxID=443616 RepID=A0ABU1VUI2_9GAMM|nr:polysaccharide biosynthesis tyrosine autokinase [Rheinheimera soli]MDR7119384.1 capsular exopolysaccharide synthesis family protein [Rheinheimera soli]